MHVRTSTRRYTMNFGKLAVLALALMLASGGIGAALADWRASDPGEPIDLVGEDARKDDIAESKALVDDDEGDGDDTRGDDGTNGGDNTRDVRAGDGDSTRGDDGTNGGDNTDVAPAPAPAPGGDDTDDGGSGGGGSDDGGSD